MALLRVIDHIVRVLQEPSYVNRAPRTGLDQDIQDPPLIWRVVCQVGRAEACRWGGWLVVVGAVLVAA
jgi:hypothetical protein